MEFSRNIGNILKGRGVSIRRCKTSHIRNDRNYTLTVFVILTAETAAPCTGTFTVTWEIVAIEQCQQRAIFVINLEELDIFLIFWKVGTLFEGQAI